MGQLYADVLMAGFGGQGIMFMGKLLAYSAMKEGKNTTWIPSYGPAMRGGTANCTVVISDEEIASPVVTRPLALIVMNALSLEVFEPCLTENGLLIMNRSLIERQVKRKDITVLSLPASEIASEIGDSRVANMVMLGAYVAYTGVVAKESIIKGLEYLLGEENKHLIDLNRKAFEKGMEYACAKATLRK